MCDSGWGEHRDQLNKKLSHQISQHAFDCKEQNVQIKLVFKKLGWGHLLAHEGLIYTELDLRAETMS